MKLTRSDHWTALAAAAIMVGGALVVFFNRYSHLVKRLPGVLLWDSNVFAAAGRMVAQGLNPYLAPVIDNPSPLPFISAPQVAIVLGGLAHVMGPALYALLTLCHIAALILTPLILSRLFLGKDWKDAALGYGLFACGLGAFGVTTIIAGNFGATLYLAIFAALIPGLRENKWLYFHIAVAIAAQVKPPYVLLWIVPILVNGWSWKQVRASTIAGAAALVPFVAAYLIDAAYFNDWLGALSRQVASGDYGFSAYGGVIRFDKSLQDSDLPMIVHALVCVSIFVFVQRDKTTGGLKASALVAFALLANPRMKEYDIAFAAIPVASLYLAAFAPAGADAQRRALAIGLILVITGVMLLADNLPLIGPFVYTIAVSAAILSLAFRPRVVSAIPAAAT